jgi:SAM-dependent methyltransferase
MRPQNHVLSLTRTAFATLLLTLLIYVWRMAAAAVLNGREKRGDVLPGDTQENFAPLRALQPKPTSCDCAADRVRFLSNCAADDEVRFLGASCVQASPLSIAGCGGLPSSFDAASDYCCFYTAEAGIVRITHERWKQAQSVESSVWNGNEGGDDRNEQHAGWFDQYKSVNGSSLGRMLEIGSGPFTQTKTIIGKMTGSVNVESITLADPLMLFYHSHVPSCPYKDGSLLGHPTQFIASGGEDLLLRSEYDTVVMMNVLEHCRDGMRVLENLHSAVKAGTGLLIFSERWYDTKWTKYERDRVPFWDVMHPINVKKALIDKLLENYRPLYRRDFFYEGNYPTDEGVYFIGVKN